MSPAFNRTGGVSMIARITIAVPYATGLGRCLTAPAGRASHRAVFHRLGHTTPIGIAVFCILYFAAQLVRGAL